MGFPSYSQALNRFQIGPADLDYFRSRGVAGNDAHIAPRSLERLRKKLDQGFVRQSIDRRSCYAHFQGYALKPRDLVLRRARLEANGESNGLTSTVRVECAQMSWNRKDSMMLSRM